MKAPSYSCTLSLTSALDWDWCSSVPSALPLEREPVLIVQAAGWAVRPVRTCVENFALTVIRCPDRPAFTESLHRLL
jgi:hypothetical protein